MTGASAMAKALSTESTAGPWASDELVSPQESSLAPQGFELR